MGIYSELHYKFWTGGNIRQLILRRIRDRVQSFNRVSWLQYAWHIPPSVSFIHIFVQSYRLSWFTPSLLPTLKTTRLLEHVRMFFYLMLFLFLFTSCSSALLFSGNCYTWFFVLLKFKCFRCWHFLLILHGWVFFSNYFWLFLTLGLCLLWCCYVAGYIHLLKSQNSCSLIEKNGFW